MKSAISTLNPRKRRFLRDLEGVFGSRMGARVPKSLREIRAGNREIRAGNREIRAGNREIRAGNREIWIFRNSSESCTLQECPVPRNKAAGPEPPRAAKPETQALVLATRIVPRPPDKNKAKMADLAASMPATAAKPSAAHCCLHDLVSR